MTHRASTFNPMLAINLFTGCLLIALKCLYNGMSLPASLTAALFIATLVHKCSPVAHHIAPFFTLALAIFLFFDAFVSYTSLLDGYILEAWTVVIIALITRLCSALVLGTSTIPEIPVLLQRQADAPTPLLIALGTVHVFNSSLALILCIKYLLRFILTIPYHQYLRALRNAFLGW